MANYQPHESQTAMILAVQIPTLAIMLLVLAARFLDRAYFTGRLLASDWLIIPASFFVVACNAILVAGLSTGMSWHVWDIKEDWIITDLKLTLAYRLLFGASAALMKISICLTYMHLFPQSKVNMWFCRCMIAYCAIAGFIFIFITTFACNPVSEFWNPFGLHRNCRNEEEILMAAVIQKATSEVVVFAWPVYFIWTLKLARTVRVGLSILFSVGSVVSAIGLVKIWYVWYAFTHVDGDISWHAVRLMLIETVELNLCLICVCLPHVKRIIKMLCCFRLRRRDRMTSEVRDNNAAAATAADDAAGAYQHKTLTIDFADVQYPAPIPLRPLARRRSDPFSISDFTNADPPLPRSTTLASLRSAGSVTMPDAPRPQLRPSSPWSSPHSYRPRLVAPRMVAPSADFDVTETIHAIYRSGSLSSRLTGDVPPQSAQQYAPPPQHECVSPPQSPPQVRQKRRTPKQKQGSPSLPRSPGSMNLRREVPPPRPPPKYRGAKAEGGGLDDDRE
ncbi:hypothetical protein SLS55_003236 [Diplodia seriata]|uniref:Rhodopsin domain-containing protein n=1 Tax=Diplodia seriata TaxID=420778 RepID=A0ABR3CQP9_9PEZI